MVLMVCSSVFQLYTAITIKQCFLKDEQVDLVLTDATPMFEKLSKEKTLLYYFRQVYYSTVTQNIRELNRIEKSRYFKPIFEMFPQYYVKKVWELDLQKYDDFYFSIYSVFNIRLQSCLYKKNKSLRTHMFEDGISTYLIDCNYKWSIPGAIKRICGIKDIKETLDDIYMFEPRLMCITTQSELVRIPNIVEKPELVEVFDEIFGEIPQQLKERFVFFEESFNNDGYVTNDSELINCLWECCERKEFLLKSHPRNRQDRFADQLPVVDFPMFWEHYFLKHSIDKNVLVTVSSNTVFVPYILARCKPTVILLYKIFEGTSPILGSGNFEKYVEKYLKYTGENVYVPETMEQYKEIVNELRKEEECEV